MRYDAQFALKLLRSGTRQRDAEFREGQEDAVRHVVEGRGRLLVVQKTGWGKSFVYFIATRLLREAGTGPAVSLAPLSDAPVLLVDDMVDSRWTLTVAAWLLRSKGSGEVWPLALASVSNG